MGDVEYYLDLEVYSKGKRPDPDKDKIITIQFQRLDLKKGAPLEPLTILKEWESSEESIVRAFFNKFFSQGVGWHFVPVGYNLSFEFEFLLSKFRRYCGINWTSRDLHYNIPHVDLKPLVILLNGGEFKGSALHNFTSKKVGGWVVPKYYEGGEFDKIEEYIMLEAEAFVEFLGNVMRHSNTWLRDIMEG